MKLTIFHSRALFVRKALQEINVHKFYFEIKLTFYACVTGLHVWRQFCGTWHEIPYQVSGPKLATTSARAYAIYKALQEKCGFIFFTLSYHLYKCMQFLNTMITPLGTVWKWALSLWHGRYRRLSPNILCQQSFAKETHKNHFLCLSCNLVTLPGTQVKLAWR